MKYFALLISLVVLQSCATAPGDSGSDSDIDEDTNVTTLDTDATTGVYASGFEASILYPCSEPEAQWWLTSNTEFAERYQMLWEPGEERAWLQGPYAFVRVNGEQTGAGEYGHLGMFEREFTVTDVVDMRGIDGEPEGDVHEWVRGVCQENS